MRSRVGSSWWVGAGTIGAALVTIAVTIAVNFATGASISEWSNTASIVAAAVAVVGLLSAVAATFFAARANNAADKTARDQEQLGFRLIRTLAAIEKEASLGNQGQLQSTSRRPLSLREIGFIMSDSGVWDDQDQISFDLAVRARNAIVHGDLEKVDPLDLRYANEKADQLLKKVREAAD